MSTSIQPNAPFRADIVGSFLRPQAVKDARAAYTMLIVLIVSVSKKSFRPAEQVFRTL